MYHKISAAVACLTWSSVLALTWLIVAERVSLSLVVGFAWAFFLCVALVATSITSVTGDRAKRG